MSADANNFPQIQLEVPESFEPHAQAAAQRCLDSGLRWDQLKRAMDILARGECLVTWPRYVNGKQDGHFFAGYGKKP